MNDLDELIGQLPEGRTVEYKVDLDPRSKKDRAQFAKSLAAFANAAGGSIVIGVNDRCEPVGVAEERVAIILPHTLHDQLNAYIDPPVEFDVMVHRLAGRQFIILRVAKSEDAPHVMKRDGAYSEGGRNHALYGKGAIFARHGAKSEPVRRNDMERIIRERMERYRRSLERNLRKVTAAAPGSEVIVAQAGGVRPTTDPGAPAVRTVLDTERVQSLEEEITIGVKLWKTDPQCLMNETALARCYATRTNLRPDQERLEMLVRSSLATWMPTCYWLSKMDRRRAVELLEERVARDVHPEARESLRILFIVGGRASRRALDVAARSRMTSVCSEARRLAAAQTPRKAARIQAVISSGSWAVTYDLGSGKEAESLELLLADRANGDTVASKIAEQLAAGNTLHGNRRTLRRLDTGLYAAAI